jgi:H3 lysine-79-specific histone-lysine N-methyltransferase
MITINTILRSLKYPALPPDIFSPTPPNTLRDAVRSWTSSGIPKKVLMRIIDETYQRCVGPHVQTLKNYEAFSSEVYGELMPSFIADIVTTTGLDQNSLFIDLGSGVGNVVMQASLQSGCKSFGIELKPAPAKVAREQLEQFKIRCKMWGIALGDVELEEGDMLRSPRLAQLIPKADVILVNNKVFLESCK